MSRKKWLLTLALGLCLLPGAQADEGMWLIQSLNKALEKNMKARGLKLDAREIYNEQAGGLSDAVVSLGFYCTGSMISDQGLMITNHHCAFSDVAGISTPEHNYLEEGFWATSRDREVPIKGTAVYFLRKVLDVTDEAQALKAELQASGKPFGFRRLSSILERKYGEGTNMEVYTSSIWGGEQYYLCFFDKYPDVRLVAAPPVTVASFGGDEDNWEWPQHKADFAIYRVYDHDGQPLRPRQRLKISTQGYKEGDFTMVLGYPGRTDRYSSAAEMQHHLTVTDPVSNRLRAHQMEIIRKWMDRDSTVRAKYANHFFSLSNVAEMKIGEERCMRRFDVIGRRRAWENSYMRPKPDYAALLDQLDAEYQGVAHMEQQKTYYRETLVRGLTITRTLLRMGSAGKDLSRQREALLAGLAETDPRVEKELLAYSLEEFLTHMDSVFLKPIHKELLSRFGTNWDAMAQWMWEHSCVALAGEVPDSELVARYQGPDVQLDPIYRFVRELSMAELNKAQPHVGDQLEMRRSYARARYHTLKAHGIPQYPDANSTMRLTYGRVCSYVPWDGVHAHWQSTARGLREKYSPHNHDFHYPDAFRDVLPPDNYPVNFITDMDITGGNSGSPVLNARGELIGLAFDGNKESLASDYEAVAGYNMCVCVDIRYVLWVLDKYAHLDYLLAEMNG